MTAPSPTKKAPPTEGGHRSTLRNNCERTVPQDQPRDNQNTSALIHTRCVVSLKIIEAALPKEPHSLGRIRSQLDDLGHREFRITLTKVHPVMSGALIRNDRAILKFLIAIFICEWIQFWYRTRDSKRIKAALLERSEIPPKQRFTFWSGFASGLVGCRLFKAIDTLKLTPGTRQELFSFAAQLPEISEIPGWSATSPLKGPRKPKS